MSLKVRLVGSALLFLFQVVAAQEPIPASSTTTRKRPGSFYFSWGYNRDWYTRSTIHFRNTTTDNYDFRVYHAHASDRPDMDGFYKLDKLTIPQYNFKIGYFFNDPHDLGIELSWDHLKYIFDDYQVAHLRGQIRGQEIDADTLLTPDFLHLQHTNGNNYLMLNLVRRQKIWKSKYLQLSGIGKVGAGALISYTISTILGNYDSGYFHYHGWVSGVSAGLRLDIYRHFFIQSDFQGAFANYTNTRLGADHQGLATHRFSSLQWLYALGGNIPIGKK